MAQSTNIKPENKSKIFLSMKDLAIRYSVNRATIYRAINKGDFPKSIKVLGCPRWSLKDLEAFDRKVSKG